jgi:Ni,Fe-hydrogenase III large subunit/Ni,Fe-hydrogenase III component G
MLSPEQLQNDLRRRFGERILAIREPVGRQLFLKVSRDDLRELARYLFQDLRARFLINAATDMRERDNTFLVSYLFSLDAHKIFVCVQADADGSDPRVDSITPIIPGANWTEREARDLVGVQLDGHPDPRRLVLADDWPASLHPLQRDVPYDIKPTPDPDQEVPRLDPPEGATVVPIGPFFPVLEEPAYFRLFVEGEQIVGCDYRGFYNHRGIEKLGDSKLTYNQIPFIAERICGICGMVHNVCYTEALENACGIEVPDRAKYIRTIILELERIHSHLLWLGIAGHIIAFDTVLMQTWRMREPVMWLCEELTGNRKTYGINIVGGVRRDIPEESHPDIERVLDVVEREWTELASVVPGDTTLMMRLRDVGTISKEDAIKMCVVGPAARGSGLAIDARVDHPYAAYDRVDFAVRVHDGCDVLARTLVRLEEVQESISIVRQCVRQMEPGELRADIGEELPPWREGICCVEAPRGEVVHYVMTGGDNRPQRWRVRAPTYANLQIVPIMIQDETVADVPIAVGSLDPCFSCTERVEVVDVERGGMKVYTQEELVAMSQRKQRDREA